MHHHLCVILPNSIPVEHLQFIVSTLISPTTLNDTVLLLCFVNVTDDNGTTLYDRQLLYLTYTCHMTLCTACDGITCNVSHTLHFFLFCVWTERLQVDHTSLPPFQRESLKTLTCFVSIETFCVGAWGEGVNACNDFILVIAHFEVLKYIVSQLSVQH